jgi:hypothetical protein
VFCNYPNLRDPSGLNAVHISLGECVEFNDGCGGAHSEASFELRGSDRMASGAIIQHVRMICTFPEE